MAYQLTARQLYCLGKLLKAQYLEYTYISAVEQLLDTFENYENEIRDELIGKGYVFEDFSGEISVNNDIKEILTPVFFSAKEASVDVCTFGENENLQINRIHIMDDKTVLVENEEDHFKLGYVDQDDVMKIIERIIPEEYSAEDAPEISAFEAEKISEMITVKTSDPEDKCVTKTYVMMGNYLYQETEEDQISVMTREEFINDAKAILTEVI